MKSKNFEKFDILTLENGLKALVYPLKEVNSVSILAIVRAGHFAETPEENGIAHILEHMLFDGTEKFPDYKKLNEFFDQIAGTYSGSTTYDFITIGGAFVQEEFENAVLGLQQLLFKPLLTQKFMQKEKGIVLDELSTLEDNNNYKNYIVTKKTRFKNNSILSLPLGGTIDSINNLKLKQIKSFHSRYFTPNNVDLVIVGKCSTEQVENILQKYFGKFVKRSLKHNRFSKKQFTNKKVKLTSQNSNKAYIRTTFPSYSWDDEVKARVSLAYICSLLANRRDSLLYSRLREDKGWIYDISCDFLVSFDIGVCEIETSTPPDKSLAVIETILDEMETIKNKQFDNKYFEKVKNIDKKRLKMVFDTPDGILKWFSEEIFYRYPKILMPKDLIDIYDSITTKDIAEVAREIFDLNDINICLLQSFQKNNELKTSFKDKIDQLIKKHE